MDRSKVDEARPVFAGSQEASAFKVFAADANSDLSSDKADDERTNGQYSNGPWLEDIRHSIGVFLAHLVCDIDVV